jgi:hypothetical protein
MEKLNNNAIDIFPKGLFCALQIIDAYELNKIENMAKEVAKDLIKKNLSYIEAIAVLEYAGELIKTCKIIEP